MQALMWSGTRIFGLIVCIFVLSGYDTAHAMALEARIKDLHGSLVSLKKKLTALKGGLEVIKVSLSGKAHSGKRKASGPVSRSVAKKIRKTRPQPAVPYITIPYLIKSSNPAVSALNALSKSNPVDVYHAFEKILLGNQGSLTEKEKEIIAYVIAVSLALNTEHAIKNFKKIQANQALSAKTIEILYNYFKSNFGKTPEAKALLAKINPSSPAPSPASSQASGDSGISVASSFKSPPPAPKLPPPTSAGSKAPLKPAVGKPESVSAGSGDLMSKITAGAGGLKKRTQKEIEEDNQRRAAKLLEQQKAKDAASGKTSAETSEAVQDSLLSSLKATLATVAKATHGSDDDDEDDSDSDWD